MIEISRDEINGLIHKYLEDEGYLYTLYTFKNEASPSGKPLSHTLTSLISKGLQYIYGCKHLKGDRVVPCRNTFRLSEEHVCEVYIEEGEMCKVVEGDRWNENLCLDQSRVDDKSDAKTTYRNKMEFGEEILDVKDSAFAYWNEDKLAVYTSTGDLFGFQLGHLLWKKKIDNLTVISWHNEDLAVGNKSGEVITINVLNNRTRNYSCHGGVVKSIRQRGKGILSAGMDGRIVVMNNGVKELVISNCSIEDCVWITDEEVGCSLDDFSVVFANVEKSSISRFGEHKDRITGIYHNHSILSTSSLDCTIGLWDTTTMKGNHIQAHEGGVNEHKWVDGRLVSCGGDGNVKLWDLEKMTLASKLSHTSRVVTVDYSSGLIASGSTDGTVIVSDVRCNEILKHNTGGTGISKVLLSQDASALCICRNGVSPMLINLKYPRTQH